MVLLSFRAGLRACEIAGLDWTMVAGADGRIGEQLEVAGWIAKNGRQRCLPIHPELAGALKELHRACDKPMAGPVIRSQRGGHMTARGVVNWFGKVYGELGFEGCSSHSGRRTFITQSARLISRAGGSLRDVQELAGHRALTTTERYIEGDRDARGMRQPACGFDQRTERRTFFALEKRNHRGDLAAGSGRGRSRDRTLACTFSRWLNALRPHSHADRVRMTVLRPGDPGAMGKDCIIAFVHTDVIVSGIGGFGQIIELQGRPRKFVRH